MMTATNIKTALRLGLLTMLTVAPGAALAEKSYWRVQGPDDTRFVLKTAMLSPLSLAGLGKSSFFVYSVRRQDTGQTTYSAARAGRQAHEAFEDTIDGEAD